MPHLRETTHPPHGSSLPLSARYLLCHQDLPCEARKKQGEGSSNLLHRSKSLLGLPQFLLDVCLAPSDLQRRVAHIASTKRYVRCTLTHDQLRHYHQNQHTLTIQDETNMQHPRSLRLSY